MLRRRPGQVGENSLIQAVYKSDDTEVGTDLFNLLTFDLSQQNVTISAAGTVNLGQFVTTNDWADVSLGFFGYTGPADNHVYFVTTRPTAPNTRSNSWSAFLGGYDGVIQYYSTLRRPRRWRTLLHRRGRGQPVGRAP